MGVNDEDAGNNVSFYKLAGNFLGIPTDTIPYFYQIYCQPSMKDGTENLLKFSQ